MYIFVCLFNLIVCYKERLIFYVFLKNLILFKSILYGYCNYVYYIYV